MSMLNEKGHESRNWKWCIGTASDDLKIILYIRTKNKSTEMVNDGAKNA